MFTVSHAPRILNWVVSPDSGHELHFYVGQGRWEAVSYPELAERARQVAAAVHLRGIGSGAVVAIAQSTGPDMIASYCGSMLVGATVCVLPTVLPMQRQQSYDTQVGNIIRLARPSLVICDGDQFAPVTQVLAGTDGAVSFTDLTAGAPAVVPHGLSGVAEYPLLQFTSGSSGAQRGVLITAAELDANHEGIRLATGIEDDEAFISWLPNHHDMGLIAMLLGALYRQYTAYFMTPQQFIHEPLQYLKAITEKKLVMTALPAFGLDYLSKRITERQACELDLSSLRMIITGAERIMPGILERFERKFGPHGLSPCALSPGYGSAEATLAVSITPAGVPWRTAAPAGYHGFSKVVGCGRPLPEVDVRIVDDQGEELPDGEVGEVVVTGPSVATRYLAAGTMREEALGSLRVGRLFTGDAGFLDHGEVFVIGRYGDGVKLLGRMVFAENVESELVARGFAAGNVTVLLGHLEEPVAVFIFAAKYPERDLLAAEIGREMLGDARLYAIDLPGAQVNRTSSGKPRRRVMWKEFVDGDLGGAARVLSLP